MVYFFYNYHQDLRKQNRLNSYASSLRIQLGSCFICINFNCCIHSYCELFFPWSIIAFQAFPSKKQNYFNNDFIFIKMQKNKNQPVCQGSNTSESLNGHVIGIHLYATMYLGFSSSQLQNHFFLQTLCSHITLDEQNTYLEYLHTPTTFFLPCHS